MKFELGPDTKKFLYIAGGTIAAYFAWQWYTNYAANASANASAAQEQEQENEAELEALMLEQPLSSTENLSAGSSGASIDTGNTELNDLVNAILNPSTTQTTNTPTSQSTTQTPEVSQATVVTASTEPGIYETVAPGTSGSGVSSSNARGLSAIGSINLANL